MNQVTAKKLMSEQEYLAFEEKSKIKHEFMDGEIFVMAGGTRFHSLTIGNIVGHLGNQLENERREVHTGDLRVKTKAANYVHPDVVIVCHPKLVPKIFDTLENPQVIFEVLSKSTKYRDKTDKSIELF